MNEAREETSLKKAFDALLPDDTPPPKDSSLGDREEALRFLKRICPEIYEAGDGRIHMVFESADECDKAQDGVMNETINFIARLRAGIRTEAYQKGRDEAFEEIIDLIMNKGDAYGGYRMRSGIEIVEAIQTRAKEGA